ncbi:MAG: hypothetical protein GXZ13_03060 [Synergistaceae bacterium]|jgi:hypothetical protein|nr:hypothetical protein [Synergistaceae bacterium]
MVRQISRNDEEQREFRLDYWIAVLVIIIIWVWGVKLYFTRYDYLRPEIAWATQGMNTEVVKSEGVLLWSESLLTSEKNGVISYPQGVGPVRVGKGTVLAVITSGSVTTNIKAPDVGYFIAGTDGLEMGWKYSQLWHEDLKPFETKALQMKKNNDEINSGEPIGKLIALPQELRFIGKIDLVGDLNEQIKNKSLRIMLDEMDILSRAAVRASKNIGNSVKVYLTLPWFPPEILKDRKYTLTIEAGRASGALIPSTSVERKNGTQIVYLVRGTRVMIKQVEGKYIEDGKFLATKGISVGDPVVKDASGAREGRIQLW